VAEISGILSTAEEVYKSYLTPEEAAKTAPKASKPVTEAEAAPKVSNPATEAEAAPKASKPAAKKDYDEYSADQNMQKRKAMQARELASMNVEATAEMTPHPLSFSEEIAQEKYEIRTRIPDAFIEDPNTAQEQVNAVRDRRVKAEQEVDRLSKQPTSRMNKINAMKELILAQSAEQAAITALNLLKVGDPSPEKSREALSIEASKMRLILVQDAARIDSLFTEKEQVTPEIKAIKVIIAEAQAKYQAELEATQEKIAEAYYVSGSTIKQEVEEPQKKHREKMGVQSYKDETPAIKEKREELEAAQKNMNSFMRHFRTKAKQQAIASKVEELKGQLRTAYHDAEMKPPEEHQTIETPVRETDSARLLALAEEVRQAHENVHSPKRFFRKKEEQEAAIKRLKEAEQRLNPPQTPPGEQRLLEAVIAAQEKMEKAQKALSKPPTAQENEALRLAREEFEKCERRLAAFRPPSEAITPGLTKHQEAHAEARSEKHVEATKSTLDEADATKPFKKKP
jgi:hypothetical protein